jgi:hypothetical protein
MNNIEQIKEILNKSIVTSIDINIIHKFINENINDKYTFCHRCPGSVRGAIKLIKNYIDDNDNN